MNVPAIGGNLFPPKPEMNAQTKTPETAGSLALGGAETAGALANNAGGSFCAMA